MANANHLLDNISRPFKFEPLPHPLTHIRVLEILPIFDKDDLTVRCRLKVVHLLDFSQCYTALSYTWGSQNERLPIIVNGAVFNIGRHLYDFFGVYRERLMQRSLPTVFLWVDAICIDHLNAYEKNAQVQIMASIYQRAKVVFAWLQPFPSENGHHDGTPALDEVVDLFVHAEKDLKQPHNYHNAQYLASKYLPPRNGSYAVNLWRLWKPLRRLCEHEFWSRRWVVSELYHASELVFMCGKLTFSFSEWKAPFILLWALTRLGVYGPNMTDENVFEPISIFTTPASSVLLSRLVLEDEMPATVDSSAKGTYAAFGAERWQWTNEREPLPVLLERYEDWQCTEAVDRVYSILGLSDSKLTVDYERSNIELFCAVLMSLKAQADTRSVYLLGKTLGLSAFSKFARAEDLPPSISDFQNGLISKAYAVKPIRFRNELADVVNARLGTNKTSFYRFISQQPLDKMRDWTDFPPPKTSESPMPKAGTPMRIVDGFDLSEPDFRPALFMNAGKALLGLASTDFIQDGDILCTESSMHAALVLRISGLSKTWLTVIGVIIFARQVGVHGEFTNVPHLNSASLNDFCEYAQPSPFTILTPWSKEYMKLKPHQIQLRGFMKEGSRPSSSLMRKLGTKSERVERWLEVVSPHRRSTSS